MTPHRASLTAQGAAVLRGVESAKSPARRICFDPYARMQVGRRLTACGDLPLPQWAASWLFHWLWPGFQEFVAARTRHFDALLQKGLEDGVMQVVILGAGYDSRAYRFSEHWQSVRLFEVDHPATQAVKQQRLRDLFGQLPQNVTYVAADMNSAPLLELLCCCGYDESRKTLFLWEGVTYYLNPAAVDTTLALVRQHAPPGSSIVFDYTTSGVIDGTCRRRETIAWRKYALKNGEALAFGLPTGGTASFLANRGFARTQVADSRWLEEAYLGAGRQRITPIFSIAHAGVE